MMIKSARIVTRAVLVVGLLVLASGASYGQQLYPLANGDFALPLSNGSISFLGGPAPLNVIGGPINLPGNHISTPLPLMLGGAPMAGFVAVPTTGGHLTILNSIGMIVGSVNLPGDHVGQLIELAASGDIAVQTSGGNLSFVSSAGAFLGADRLQPTPTATTVRVREGETLTTDGPFAETKEQLGGYYMIDVDNLDDAIAWAAK